MSLLRRRLLAGSLAAVLFALVVLLPTPVASEGRTRFTVAILRRDGVLMPFANYDRGRWSTRWPTQPETAVPIGLGDIPRDWWQEDTPALRWAAWLTSGGRRDITVTGPLALRILCTRRIALRTDFVAVEPAPPPMVQPYPKAGLAIAGADIRVEPVNEISLASPTAKAFAQAVAAPVAEAETERAKRWAPVWRHPATEKARAETPLVLELLSRSYGLDGTSEVRYFEGVKKYAGLPRWRPGGKTETTLDMCDYLTFAGGWVVGDPADPKARPQVGAELTNCQREGVVYGLPLGAIRVDGRLYWVLQSSGWDVERYDIVEIRKKEVKTVFSVWAGACP